MENNLIKPRQQAESAYEIHWRVISYVVLDTYQVSGHLDKYCGLWKQNSFCLYFVCCLAADLLTGLTKEANWRSRAVCQRTPGVEA